MLLHIYKYKMHEYVFRKCKVYALKKKTMVVFMNVKSFI